MHSLKACEGLNPKFINRIIFAFLTLAIGISYAPWFNLEPDYIFKISLVPYLQILIPFLTSVFLLITGLFALKPSMQNKYTVTTIVIITILLFLANQLFMQPWFYQYVLMLVITWKMQNHKKRYLAVMQVFLASIYIWSGIQKINILFFEKMFPWVLQPIIEISDPKLGILAVAIEVLIGIGLLIKSTRKLSAILIVFLHLFILLCIGPFGRDWNHVVWPWNFAMMVFVLIFFWKTPFRIENLNLKPTGYLLLSVFLLLPGLNYIGLWDAHFSFSLYSARKNRAQYLVSLEDSDKINFPEKHLKLAGGGEYLVDLGKIYLEQTRLPIPPEIRIYKSILRQICKFSNGESYSRALIYTPQGKLWNRLESQEYKCSDFTYKKHQDHQRASQLYRKNP